LKRDLVRSQRTRERTAIHLVGERGIKSKLFLPGALSISGLGNAEWCQLSIRYDKDTCALGFLKKAYSMTSVPIGSPRLCLTLTNNCHNMIMSSSSFRAGHLIIRTRPMPWIRIFAPRDCLAWVRFASPLTGYLRKPCPWRPRKKSL